MTEVATPPPDEPQAEATPPKPFRLPNNDIPAPTASDKMPRGAGSDKMISVTYHGSPDSLLLSPPKHDAQGKLVQPGWELRLWPGATYVVPEDHKKVKPLLALGYFKPKADQAPAKGGK